MACGPLRIPFDWIEGNLFAMFIHDLSGIISASYAPRRDGDHLVFCPLIADVSENEHRQSADCSYFLASRE
jgi:hypothetical protein